MVSFRAKGRKKLKVTARVIRGKRTRIGTYAPGIVNRSRRRKGKQVGPAQTGVGAVTG